MVVRRILVATDLSTEGDHAVRYGYRLAQRLHADVALLHVHGGAQATPARDPDAPTDQFDLHTRLLHELSAIAAHYGAEGVCTRVIVRTGREGPALLAAARELPAELIVLSTHQLHGIEHALFEASADERLSGIRCPVIAVPAPAGDAPNAAPSARGLSGTGASEARSPSVRRG